MILENTMKPALFKLALLILRKFFNGFQGYFVKFVKERQWLLETVSAHQVAKAFDKRKKLFNMTCFAHCAQWIYETAFKC